MPTYEYACRSCKRHTEAVQTFTDPPLTECPHCGGELKRVFHPVGILLKGSGFYSTDNRSAKRTLAQTKDEASGKADSASSDSSKESSKDGAAKPVPAKKDTPKESKPAAKKESSSKKPESKK